jgi:phospholipid/cholesterol/gamma-HCH transport system substrate-binding protein
VNKLVTPFRVGLLVLVALGILFATLTFVKKGGLKEDDSVLLHAFFKDASGLTRRSRVQIAGIGVGEITDIKLEGLKAKVFFRVKKELTVRENASLTKRSESLLGDYMIDLTPGTEEFRVLENDEEVKKVVDAQGMEQIFGSLTAITSDIQTVTSSLKNVLGGTQGQGSMEAIVANLVKLTQDLDKTIVGTTAKLDTILLNVEGVSSDVRKITAREQGSITNIVDNIESVSKDVREVMVSVKRIVGQNEGEVASGVSNVKETLAKLDRTLANLETVT